MVNFKNLFLMSILALSFSFLKGALGSSTSEKRTLPQEEVEDAYKFSVKNVSKKKIKPVVMEDEEEANSLESQDETLENE